MEHNCDCGFTTEMGENNTIVFIYVGYPWLTFALTHCINCKEDQPNFLAPECVTYLLGKDCTSVKENEPGPDEISHLQSQWETIKGFPPHELTAEEIRDLMIDRWLIEHADSIDELWRSP